MDVQLDVSLGGLFLSEIIELELVERRALSILSRFSVDLDSSFERIKSSKRKIIEVYVSHKEAKYEKIRTDGMFECSDILSHIISFIFPKKTTTTEISKQPNFFSFIRTSKKFKQAVCEHITHLEIHAPSLWLKTCDFTQLDTLSFGSRLSVNLLGTVSKKTLKSIKNINIDSLKSTSMNTHVTGKQLKTMFDPLTSLITFVDRNKIKLTFNPYIYRSPTVISKNRLTKREFVFQIIQRAKLDLYFLIVVKVIE